MQFGQRPYKAAVFDCDGLLIETRNLWKAAWEPTARRQLDDGILAELAGASTRTGAMLLENRLGVHVEPTDVERRLLAGLKEQC